MAVHMADHEPSPESRPARRYQVRFGIGTLLMVMLVFSVMATAGSYLVRSASQTGRPAHLVFILFTLSAPTLMMIAVSVIRQCLDWLKAGKGT
jgi:hypothetical protein